ncbi:hypothetical protein JE592_000074 [Salmonella enterica]|nr:hypothetical protein [Salmonella enterica]ELW2864654.1 hypothetical protein [Salmonella enterica]
MPVKIARPDNQQQLPEDKISNKEIIELLNITTQEFSSARKWRPEDFPKGIRAGKSIFYSKKEIIEFFGKYGYKPKIEPRGITLVAAKLW